MKYNDYLVANETNLNAIAKNFAELIENAKQENEKRVPDELEEEPINENAQIALDILDGIEFERRLCADIKKNNNEYYRQFLSQEEKNNEEMRQNLLGNYFGGKAQYRELDDITYNEQDRSRNFLNLILLGLILNSLNLYKRDRSNEGLLNFATDKLSLVREIL